MWTFDAVADAVYLQVSGETVARTDEIAEGLILDLDASGAVRGIEVLWATSRTMIDFSVLSGRLPEQWIDLLIDVTYAVNANSRSVATGRPSSEFGPNQGVAAAALIAV